MIEARIFRLRCDTCRAAWISPEGNNPAQARRAAERNGWTSSDDLDRCPRCTRHRAES